MNADPAEECAFHVSVVVPTYDNAEQLKRLLASFDSLDTGQTIEFLVVDDCSSDETEVVVRRWCTEPCSHVRRYIRLARNAGPAAARNEGARQACGAVVAFTDTDCIVTPDWIDKLTKKLNIQQRIVGVGGRVLPFDPDETIARYNTEYHILEPPASTLYLVSANCCFFREPLLEVGGFAEEIPYPGGEDIALCIKLWNAGWRFAFTDDAVIHHDYCPKWRNFCKTWYRYGFGSAFVSKHYLEHGGGEVHPIDSPTGEQGWYPNPLVLPKRPLKAIYHDIRGAFHMGYMRYGSRRVGAEFALLRCLQLVIHRIAWQRGLQADTCK